MKEKVTELSYRGAVRSVAGGFLVPDRRIATDRRTMSWRTFLQGGLTPRRRASRRDAESHGLVDWHAPHLLFLSITILLLSVADAFLTLTLIKQGATEANPLVKFVLDEHPRFFGGAKMVLTGVGVLVLVALARARVFRLLKVEVIMHWFLLAYVALVAYECWLLRQSL
jgi:hypothetical protein